MKAFAAIVLATSAAAQSYLDVKQCKEMSSDGAVMMMTSSMKVYDGVEGP